LGIPTRELQHRISSAEFVEYLAYFQVEPWPEERADINTAIIASILANTVRDSKTRPKPFTIQDFIIQYWKNTAREATQQSVERMKATMSALATTLERSLDKGKP